MKQLSGSFFTNYSTSGDFTLKANRAGKNTACFAESFRRLSDVDRAKQKYSIYIYKAEGNNPYSEKGNATFLTKKELSTFIGSVKNVFPFTFKIEETDDYFLVHLKIDGLSIYHKFILTWVRYTYEYPFNVCCLYTMEMRKNPKYCYINTINLMHSISIQHCYMGGHAIINGFKNPKFYTYAQLAKRMKGQESLHGIHKSGKEYIPNYKAPSRDANRKSQLESWTTSKSTYVKYYKKCK